jgi:hypothetical protein
MDAKQQKARRRHQGEVAENKEKDATSNLLETSRYNKDR